MTLKLDLKEIERRANQAAYQDGLTEIFMGLFLFFYGGSLATDTLPVGIIFIVFAVFFAKPAIERIKRRYIYPRTGYVKVHEDPNTTAKGIGISAIIMVVVLLSAMAISMAILGQNQGMHFFLTYIVPPASGFMLAIGPYWLAQTYGLIRGYVWAVLFIFGGIAMPIFQIATGYEAVGLLCTVIGLIILIVGVLMFVQFIRQNPAQPLEIEAGQNV
jgi:hypothetical protein